MRITPAKDVYGLLVPLYVLSKILGLAPYKLIRNGTKRLVANCGPIVFLRFACVIGAMTYVLVTIESLQFSSDFAGIALRCELYLGTLMTAAVLVLSVTNQKSIIESVDRIASIDECLKALGADVTYTNAQIFVYTQVIFITCLFTSKIIMQIFSSSTALLLIYSAFNYVDYLNTIMLFQYVDLLLLLRQRFVWLNRCVRRLATPRWSQIFAILQVKSAKQGQNPEPKLTLISLGKTYGRLCATSRMVNRAYGIQILVTMCCRFVMITTQLINIYDSVVENTRNAINYVLLVVYIALHSVKIFMLAGVSENTAEKAKHTGIYLHELWSSLPHLRDQIEDFSLQILHQNLTFTACGFFTLDYTLIYAIVGAVTTYFVIMIQFDKSRPQ